MMCDGVLQEDGGRVGVVAVHIGVRASPDCGGSFGGSADARPAADGSCQVIFLRMLYEYMQTNSQSFSSQGHLKSVHSCGETL